MRQRFDPGPLERSSRSARATIREYAWVACLAAAYLFLFVRVQWRVGDEGDMLNGALAVAEGRVPYRDFCDLRGPAAFYWLGSFFRVFGATWYVARAHLLLTGALSSLLVYHLARRVCRPSDALLACGVVTAVSLPSWPASHHHWDSNLFALAAAAAFFRWKDRESPMWLAASGVLAGLTSCFIYQKGFLLLVSFIALIAIERFVVRRRFTVLKATGLVIAGYVAIGVGVFAWFAHLGALPDFVNATIVLPVNSYVDANRVPYGYQLIGLALGGNEWATRLPAVATGLSAVLLALPYLLVAALPFLLGTLAAFHLMTRPREALFTSPVLAYGLVGYGLWLSEFHRRDGMHLIYGCPVLLIALFGLRDDLDGNRFRRVLVSSALGVSVAVVMAAHGLRAAGASETIVTRRGTIVVPNDDSALRFLLSDEVRRGDYVFVYPYYATYYFLADVRNPTRYGEMIYGPGAKPYFDEAIAAIEARKVKYILWDTAVDADTMKQWFPSYDPPQDGDRWMEHYIEEHYDQVDLLNGFRIMRRR